MEIAMGTGPGFMSLIIHGGAGQLAEDRVNKKLPVMRESLDAGWKAFCDGGTGEDAVTAAVQVMEDCEYFNAGYGGYPNANNIVLLDAAIMNGKREYVALMNVRRLKYPSRVACDLLQKEKSLSTVWTHELMEAYDAHEQERKERYGWVKSHEELLSPYVVETLRKQEGEFSKDKVLGSSGSANPDHLNPEIGHGTVGACSSDMDGGLFTCISTGGVNHKVNGRIGDAPMVGLGLYADNDLCAMTTTGYGEALLACFPTGFIIGRVRDEARKDPEAFHKDENLMKRIVDEEFEEFSGKGIQRGGGIICIPRHGKPTYAFNTQAMPVGIAVGTRDKRIQDEVFVEWRDGRRTYDYDVKKS
ncbi:MAG: isoaspartyl peptidase/L-asparaginase [Bdellovibrionales bacterium]|nr:isoaspartyl peptidase/L-asparaginase [Bdellovibrionales bacterium]